MNEGSGDSICKANTICYLMIGHIVLSLGFIIIVFVFSFIHFTQIRIGADFYAGPAQNWDSDVVIDFQTAENCTAQQMSSVFNYMWPGTISGCDCFFNQGVRKERCCSSASCKTDITECQGTDVKPNIGKNIDQWQIDENPVRICAQRLKGYSFAQQTPGQNNCTTLTDFQCGQGTENMFCVPREEDCPIRNYTIAPFDPIYNQIYEGNIRISQQLYFYYTKKDYSRSPLVDFKIVEGESVCLRNSISIGSPGRSTYILLVEGPDNSCEIDDRFINTNISMGEKSFFRINQLDEIVSKLPGYDIDDKYKYYSFYTSIFKLDYNCRQYVDQLVDNDKDLKRLVSYSVSIVILTGFLVSYYLIIDPILTIALRKIYTVQDWYGFVWFSTSAYANEVKIDWSRTRNFFAHFFVGFKVLTLTGDFIMIYYAYSVVTSQRQFLQNFVQIQCTDHYLLRIIQNVLAAFQEDQIYIMMPMITWMFIFDPTNMWYVLLLLRKIRALCCGKQDQYIVDS